MDSFCRTRGTQFLLNLAVAALLFNLPRAAAAQRSAQPSTVQGRIVDAAGAPVGHAQLLAREESTGAERGASVDSTGRYSI